MRRELNKLRLLVASHAGENEVKEHIDDMIWRIDNA